jgi:uncharacterized membrane protein
MSDSTRKARSVAADEGEALQENIDAVKLWEEAALHQRSAAEVLSDRITSIVTGGPALVAHAAWFSIWILINSGVLPFVTPFDQFPFPLLTLVVSLEAIFLTLFVLLSQNRMTARADKRAHLDLQIDLLAEREMTAMLRLLLDVAHHLDVKPSLTEDQMADLVKKTDVRRITAELEKLPAEGK